MNNQLPLFFSFLHRALAQDERSSLDLEKINWNLFFHFSQEQAIVSVVFEKIQNDKIRIDKELLFNWFAQYELIKRRNILMNHRALEVTKVFADAGFRSCILKGQGNNLLKRVYLPESRPDLAAVVPAGTECIFR